MIRKILRRREPVFLYTGELSELLQKAALAQSSHKSDILDLGCGDGAKFLALQEKGLLRNAKTVVGVDTSPQAIKALTENIKKVTGIIADACNVKELDDSSFDLIICSMLIEHVADDRRLLQEIRRLLRGDGIIFVSSVIKKKYGFWLYRRDGAFRLAPEHVREYSSAKEFLTLLEKEGFEIIEYRVTPIKGTSLVGGLTFVLFNLGWIKPSSARNIYVRRPWLKSLTKVAKIPIGPVGFYAIEVLARKKGGYPTAEIFEQEPLRGKE